ncbi:MAG: hypothetical protein JWP11_420 [Frankiales bacterium]|nr:hypothetical protein [Frankiales bacterium]
MESSLPPDPASSERVHQVAQAQRRVLIAVLLNLIANGLIRGSSGSSLAGVAVVLALAIAGFCIYWVYRLCRALDTTPWAYMVAMLIPLIGLICLFVLSARATTFLKAHGVKVGLLGSKA